MSLRKKRNSYVVENDNIIEFCRNDNEISNFNRVCLFADNVPQHWLSQQHV